jgi:hypothetical protein
MKSVRVINTSGLKDAVIAAIDPVMIYKKDYYADELDGTDTRFVELQNSRGDIIRILPERIEVIA